MSTKGGYLIVDLKGNDIATLAGENIPGIYETLEGNYGKPVLVSGIVVDGVEKPDVFVTANLDEGEYLIDVYGYHLGIGIEDDVYNEGLIVPAIYKHNIVCIDGNTVEFSFLSTDQTEIDSFEKLYSMRTKFYGVMGFDVTDDEIGYMRYADQKIILYYQTDATELGVSSTVTDTVVAI